MLALFKKEISVFFSSIIGYLVIVVFLTIVSLFLWVFPGDLNVLDSGYASLETLFIMAPWVFLFLIPAITMRSFADEKKSGNLDLLFVRPVSEMQIILAKYGAALTLVIFSLIPTLVYFYSIYQLGNPPGNIDMGGTWGSYLGLIFLAAIYVAVGIFTSSLTDNSIVSFILAVVICFILYTGFDFVAELFNSGKWASPIAQLGINAHYKSISRGVLDSRDIIYFISAIIIFNLFSRLKLQGRKW